MYILDHSETFITYSNNSSIYLISIILTIRFVATFYNSILNLYRAPYIIKSVESIMHKTNTYTNLSLWSPKSF